ncbi:MAG: glycosyltransferase family 2 protein [Thermodesulfobacteriota bacterium]|nr:glycosyltransferase family 2 protein [Thermodesulfobacteriota bacterium]
MKVSVVIPVYNEENGIGAVLDEIYSSKFGKDFEIIVVDDGSTDHTPEIVKSKGSGIKFLSHETNQGYGAALKTGIRHAKNDIVVITDADGTYPNHEIPKLVGDMNEYDMVVGARTNEIAHIPMIRRPAKWFLNKLAAFMSNRDIPDLNSGFRAIKKEIVESFFHILPNGFSFTSSITLAMLANGYKVKYTPIDYYKRKGKSKIHPIHDTLNFLQLIIRTILYFDPLKVFLPISILFFTVSFFMLFYRLFVGHGFGVTTTLFFVCGVQLLAIGMIADLIDKRMK